MHQNHREEFTPEKDPLRYSVTLGSFACWLCGADALSQCDIVAHQEYANSTFPCTACGASAGDVCLPNCPAANTLTGVLTALHAF